MSARIVVKPIMEISVNVQNVAHQWPMQRLLRKMPRKIYHLPKRVRRNYLGHILSSHILSNNSITIRNKSPIRHIRLTSRHTRMLFAVLDVDRNKSMSIIKVSRGEKQLWAGYCLELLGYWLVE